MTHTQPDWPASAAGRSPAQCVRRSISSGIAIRTAAFDEMLMQAITNRGVRAVLNLGAGLDTRPYRLDLPPALRWVEADLPGIIAYKERMLEGERPRCQLKRSGVDLADGVALQNVLDEAAAGRSTLVLSEGVLVYLAAENVADLASELAKRRAYRWWLTDMVGPLFLLWGARMAGRRLSAAGMPLRFAPPEGPDFFRSFGWQVAELRSAWLETRRLGREQLAMRLAWIASFGKRRERYRTVGSFVLMERSTVCDHTCEPSDW